MTLTAIPGGLLFPFVPWMETISLTGATDATLNAATDKLAMIGYAYIDGRATSKTMGGGSSAISFRTGTSTFADGSTNIDIGIQDVATSAGPPGQPDGTFDCFSSFVGSGGGIASASWNNCAIGSANGTKTVSHGQLIAVVFDMTAVGGSDSVIIQTADTNASVRTPFTNNFDAGAWGSSAEGLANVLLTFSDGTLGTLDGATFITSMTSETFASTTNPDERGNIFQVPWDCQVDAIVANMGITDASSDFSAILYSAPGTTPVAEKTIAVTADSGMVTGANEGLHTFLFDAPVTLSKNTDYVAAILATGSSNVRLMTGTLADAAYRALLPGSTNCNKAVRNDGSGAFTETTTVFYPIGVRISSLHDTGSTGGGIRLAGHGGLAA